MGKLAVVENGVVVNVLVIDGDISKLKVPAGKEFVDASAGGIEKGYERENGAFVDKRPVDPGPPEKPGPPA